MIIDGKIFDPRRIPLHQHYRISKDRAQLTKEEQWSPLGYPKGSIAQYRGKHGLHILEYRDHYEYHRDVVDPRKDPIGHLAVDAPETILMVIAGLGVMVLLGGILATGASASR